jgi:hypothetical protein
LLSSSSATQTTSSSTGSPTSRANRDLARLRLTVAVTPDGSGSRVQAVRLVALEVVDEQLIGKLTDDEALYARAWKFAIGEHSPLLFAIPWLTESNPCARPTPAALSAATALVRPCLLPACFPHLIRLYTTISPRASQERSPFGTASADASSGRQKGPTCGGRPRL